MLGYMRIDRYFTKAVSCIVHFVRSIVRLCFCFLDVTQLLTVDSPTPNLL